MGLKLYKPTTPSQRHRVTVDRTNLWPESSFKGLTKRIANTGGRNNLGRTVSYHKGGGYKKLYRLIDFKRSLINVAGKVLRLEYDPNRSAWIALILYQNGIVSYILAPEGLNKDDTIMAGEDADISVGNALPLYAIPVGTIIHNVELKPGKGSQISRSAGCYAQLIKKDANGYSLLRLSSGELRLVSLQCFATVGKLSNADHQHIQYGKAGASRWKGIRPTVRGVAMNPVDHPHGGGEGRTGTKRAPVSPWGKLTKGSHTRRNKRTSKFIVSKRS